jgi:hypothetical protein
MDRKMLIIEIEKLSLLKQISLIKELFLSPYDRLMLAEELFPEHLSCDEEGQYIIFTGVLKPGSVKK